MIDPDILEDWRGYEVSQIVIRAMQKRKDALTESMQLGHFIDESNMESTFGQCSHAAGEMVGLNVFFDIISGGIDSED
jgi:hypothetical protein